MNLKLRQFKREIFRYYNKEGRKLPWRKTRNPYRILVSEVMLQQTQVSRVLKFYEKFLKRFPDFESLHSAKLHDVLSLWQGLGYNRRALNLKKLSAVVVREYKRKLPRTEDELKTLPGIGPGTAGAIMAFAYNKPAIFIETNIRRVYIHFFFPKKKRVEDKEILKLIEETLDRKNPREWYYALMDYGAMFGRQGANSNMRSAHYKKQKSFHGSDRKIRGEILRILLQSNSVKKQDLARTLKEPKARVEKIIDQLKKDGLIYKKGRRIGIRGG